jgi:methylmalonyl-CoA mutase, N-terminal domain
MNLKPMHYRPQDAADVEYARDLGDPGEFPYTRGIHPTGYRTRVWTMRQVAGFRTAEESNAWFKVLLRRGATGLSVAFDLPTLMGCDPDSSFSIGEVGKCGVNVASAEDMDRLFENIPLDQVSTSLIINGPAATILAMYLVTAERQGVAWDRLTGTLQNDILKEYMAQNEYLYPPAPSMRLVSDVIAFCARQVPRFNSISVSGYHIREAGADAVQELAFTLRNGIEYVQHAVAAGLQVDEFAPRVSFFFNAHSDFFEEVAKYRAARKLWASELRARFGAADPRSLKLRFHTQTSGVSLTSRQPYNNVVRTAVQALAAVLGGTQSLHTNSLDEALGLPTPEAATLALRTQQILACETGVTSVIDPLGGSYYVEALTKEMEEAARCYFHRIDALGGMVRAVEAGLPQSEIANSAFEFQRSTDAGERRVVGLNAFCDDEAGASLPVFQVDDGPGAVQAERIGCLRRRRDSARVGEALDRVRAAARTTDVNVMPPILEAVRVSATLGEVSDALTDVWGTFTAPPLL